MTSIKLRDEVIGKAEIEYRVKPALFGTKCDICGVVYGGPKKNTCTVKLSGDPALCGREVYEYDICSLKCAIDIQNGDWRKHPTFDKIKLYTSFMPVHVISMDITIFPVSLENEESLVARWEASREENPPKRG